MADPDIFFDANGDEVAVESLEIGDLVYDIEGREYELTDQPTHAVETDRPDAVDQGVVNAVLLGKYLRELRRDRAAADPRLPAQRD
jgi:hypothetical protein